MFFLELKYMAVFDREQVIEKVIKEELDHLRKLLKFRIKY